MLLSTLVILGIVVALGIVAVGIAQLVRWLRANQPLTLDHYRPIALWSLLFISFITLTCFVLRTVNNDFYSRLDAWGVAYLGLAALIIVLPFLKSIEATKEGLKGELNPILQAAKNMALVTESLSEKADQITSSPVSWSWVGTSNSLKFGMLADAVSNLERRDIRSDLTASAVRALGETPDEFFFVKLSTEIEKRLYAAAVAGGLDIPEKPGTERLIDLLRKNNILGASDAEKVESIRNLRNMQAHGKSVDDNAIKFMRQEVGSLLTSLDQLVLIARHERARRLLAEKVASEGFSFSAEHRRAGRVVDFRLGDNVVVELKAVPTPGLSQIDKMASQLASLAAQNESIRALLILATEAPLPATVGATLAKEYPKVAVVWLTGDRFEGNLVARENFPWLFD